MINKNKFSIRNTKKVLHKVGKQWVVVSAVLLGLVAGGTAVNEMANADTTAQAAQPTTQISPADKAKAQNTIADLKAHKGDIVNKSVNEVHAHVNPQNHAQSNAYQNLASMANASNLAKFSNGEALGEASSANSDTNTWFGALQNAENDAYNIDGASSHYVKALGLVNKALSNKLPSNVTLNDQTLQPSDIQNYLHSNSSVLTNAVNSKLNSQNTKNYLNGVVLNGIENGIKKQTVSIPFLGKQTIGNLNPDFDPSNVHISYQLVGKPSLTGINNVVANPSNVIVDIPQNTTIADAINNGVHATANVNFGNVSFSGIPSATISCNVNGVLKMTIKGRTKSLPIDKTVTESLPNNPVTETVNVNKSVPYTIPALKNDSFSTSTIANIIQGQPVYSSNTVMNAIEKQAHNQIVSTVEQNNPTKGARILNAAVDAIHAGNQMLANSSMSADYNGIVSALATLPNDNTANPTNKSSFANEMMSAANDANDLANSYAASNYGSATADSSADSSDTISLLRAASRQASSYAKSLDSKASAAAKPAAAKYTDTVNISGAYSEILTFSGASGTPESVSANDGYYFTNNGSSVYSFNIGNSNATINLNVAANSSTPNNGGNNNQNNNSNNTNNNNIPYIAPNNFASSAAAQINSASAKPSTSAGANSNSVAPKKHMAKGTRVVNYVTVNKALQLHTSPYFTKKNGVMVVKPGTELNVLKSVKARGLARYEVNYKGKKYYITANKRFDTRRSYLSAKPTSYHYVKTDKALQLHTSPYFTKKNGVMVVKPGAEFRINHVIKAHGLVRYEVTYKGKTYFITANKHFANNAYLQKSNFRKHGYKAVRAIKPVNEYRHADFTKRGLVRHFRRGTVLPVRRVLTIGKGEVTRLQLTNGRYVSANNKLVNVIK